jgi:hypothetical protein
LLYFADWHYPLLAPLGVMFLLTASAHWGKRRPDLLRMVPEGIGRAGLWVFLTGAAEIGLAIALQIPGLAPWTAAAGVTMVSQCCAAYFPPMSKLLAST